MDNIPWEIYNFYNKLEKKILISYNSTACFTPKIIYDEEPTIIMLFKIKELGIKNENYNDAFLKNIKKIYKDPQKIIIPTTFFELKKVVAILNKKN